MRKPTNANTQPSEEFTRFRELAKHLVAVPKKEIDNKKAVYDRKKAQTKKPVK